MVEFYIFKYNGKDFMQIFCTVWINFANYLAEDKHVNILIQPNKKDFGSATYVDASRDYQLEY